MNRKRNKKQSPSRKIKSTSLVKRAETAPVVIDLGAVIEGAKPVARGAALITSGTGVMTATSSIPEPLMNQQYYEEAGYGLAFFLIFGGILSLMRDMFYPRGKTKALEDKTKK